MKKHSHTHSQRRTTAIMIGLMLGLGLPFQGCGARQPNGTAIDTQRTIQAGNKLQMNMPTPTDIDYSLERYNLIRRTYWINGQRERARTLPNPVPNTPLGHIVLFTQNGAIIGKFIVSGKVTSLNSYLTPDSEYYSGETSSVRISSMDNVRVNKWLPDVDGTYGKNDNGIFFFTPDGKYIEWNGTYLYSDIPFEIPAPVIKISQN
jgi:hypothetical protein